MAETSAKTLRTLETVGSRPGQARRERLSRLSEAERELYRWSRDVRLSSGLPHA
jgi:hypothetical protein